MEGIQVTIAPWALPREEIPVGIVIRGSDALESIDVEWSSGLELRSTINVSRLEKGRRRIRVTRLASGPIDGAHYCGIVLRHRTLPTEAVTFAAVKAHVLFRDGKVQEVSGTTRIGRPFLELVESPSRISLDYGSESQLPLSLKYQGFGDIEVRIQARLRGKIVSHGDSLVYELIKRLLEGEAGSETASTAAKPAIEVDPRYVRKLLDAVETMLASKTPMLSALDPKRVRALRKWLSSAKARRGFIDAILTARINQLLVSILGELLGRSPADGITLKHARTSIDARIQAPVTRLQIEIDYRDRMGNEYNPVRTEVEVEDRTVDGGPRRVRIPITITRWAQDPVLNISGLFGDGG